MRFRTEGPIARDARMRQWHWWFAWRPVRLAYRDGRGDGEMAWLEWVGRRFNGRQVEYQPPGETPLRKTEAAQPFNFAPPRRTSSPVGGFGPRA